jgi:uncharacterized Tic20 family protein
MSSVDNSDCAGHNAPALFNVQLPVVSRKGAPMPKDDLRYPNESPEQSPVELTSEERNWGMFCHLSSLLGYFAGFLSFVGRLVCWLVKKDTSEFVNDHGKEALNVQLNILIYLLVSIPIAIVTCGIGFILTLLIALFGFIMPIIAGIQAGGGELYRYPLTFRLVK